MKRGRRAFLAGAAATVAAAAGAALRRPVGGPGCAPGWRPAPAPDPLAGAIVGASHSLGHVLRGGHLPSPSGEVSTTVVIVGAGISGLSVAWKLLRSGVEDLVVCDLEPRAGGTAASGESPVTGYPWGAHYVPLPSPESRAVVELFEDLGVIVGRDATGRPIYREEYLCAAPQERLFLHGRWHEGLFPMAAASSRDVVQVRAFREEMARYRQTIGSDGRRAFAVPMELSSTDRHTWDLDRMSMRDLLDRLRLDSALLRWYVEYACRDDYGLSLETTSAWAGVHYHAGRPRAPDSGGEPSLELTGNVLTWPEGNGWIVRQLAGRLGGRVHTGRLAFRVEEVSPPGRGVAVDVLDAATGRVLRYRAAHVVLAVPKLVARRIDGDLERRLGTRLDTFTYSPWMVANLHVRRVPEGPGAPPAWDNVLYASPSLGYIVATHQALAAFPGPSVLTYYLPLTARDPSTERQAMLGRRLEDWRDLVLGDLTRAHPDLPGLLTRLDVMLWGHAMVRPVPGFLSSEARRRAARLDGPILLAHSDSSGLPLFEEAQYRGVWAAERILERLGVRFSSSLG